jgi:hypothetical protein
MDRSRHTHDFVCLLYHTDAGGDWVIAIPTQWTCTAAEYHGSSPFPAHYRGPLPQVLVVIGKTGGGKTTQMTQ